MRDIEGKETVKLSEFQEEIVQMAAALNGDHKKEIYPQRLVENMTVAEAVKYVDGALKKLCDECQKAEERGMDESEIGKLPERSKSKSFVHKMLSCLVCHS